MSISFPASVPSLPQLRFGAGLHFRRLLPGPVLTGAGPGRGNALGGIRRIEPRRSLTERQQTIASYWLPRHLARFHLTHPGIDIRLDIGNTAQVAKSVAEGTAEIGFVEGQIEEELLTSRVIARDRMVVVVSPDHPWAGRKHVAPEELLTTGWILRERGSGTRSEFETALADFGLDRAAKPARRC